MRRESLRTKRWSSCGIREFARSRLSSARQAGVRAVVILNARLVIAIVVRGARGVGAGPKTVVAAPIRRCSVGVEHPVLPQHVELIGKYLQRTILKFARDARELARPT